MAKPAPPFEAGQRVVKRGYPHEGTVIRIRGRWITVKWDAGMKPRERPLICEAGELQKVSA